MNGYLPENASAKHAGGGTEHFIDLLRTLADPIRLRILRLLEQQPQHGATSTGGLSVGELAEILKLPQSTVSRHLKTLADAHLADVRREGTSMLYRLSDAAGHNASKQLRSVAKQHLDHDPLAKTDGQRLSHILRQRDSATDHFFGKHAPHWDSLRAQWLGDSFHSESLVCLLNPQWTVADLGTGTGVMLPLLAPHVEKIIAIDPSPAMLKNAKARVSDQHLHNVELRQGAIENLPIEDHTIDVAIVSLVLAYLPDPPAALREIHRILKPGGITLIIDLQPHDVALFREKLNHRWMGFAQGQLEKWLKEAHFTLARWHPLTPKVSRSKESQTQVPDLFAIRAEAAPV